MDINRDAGDRVVGVRPTSIGIVQRTFDRVRQRPIKHTIRSAALAERPGNMQTGRHLDNTPDTFVQSVYKASWRALTVS